MNRAYPTASLTSSRIFEMFQQSPQRAAGARLAGVRAAGLGLRGTLGAAPEPSERDRMRIFLRRRHLNY